MGADKVSPTLKGAGRKRFPLFTKKGRGHKTCYPVLRGRWGGGVSFGPVIFPFCSPTPRN